MRRLLDDWRELTRRLRDAPSIALFLDFDGTLAPLVADPRDVVFDRIARAALMRLSANGNVRTWVISGRREADLRAHVGLSGVRYLGVHGGDRAADCAGGALLSKETLKTIERARRDLASRLNGNSGVRIEDKGMAFAVHHRNARESEIGHARRLLEQVIERSIGALRIVPGDRVWEVLPREIRGKGAAVRRELRLYSAAALPIYIGNDGTDETAFEALSAGITARVGPARPTRAHYVLRDPLEVGRVLEMLEEELRCTEPA